MPRGHEHLGSKGFERRHTSTPGLVKDNDKLYSLGLQENHERMAEM